MNIKIEGMTCGHCEGRVKGELEKLGLEVQSISAESGSAVVDGNTDEAAIRGAVVSAGYKFVSVS